MKKHPMLAAGLLCAALLPATSQAQTTPPDAGQTLREQPRSALPARSAAPSISIPVDAEAPSDTGMRFAVRALRIEGNAAYPAAELEALLSGLIGEQVGLGDLRRGAARITAYYRERGYIVARAFVPAQELTDGTVRITVLEGRLNSTRTQNGTIVQQNVLERVVAAQALDGKVIRADTTDRTLLLLADLPAVGKVEGSLKPGDQVGSSDLLISASAGRPYDGDVSADNYGNRYTGAYRLNGALNLNSPMGLGERLALRATATDHALYFGRMAYDLPVGGDGLRAGVALSSSSYSLGREFANLDAGGRVNTAGVLATYPLVRGVLSNVWLAGTLETRSLFDETRSTGTRSRKQAQVFSMDAYGDIADALGAGGYTTWRVSASRGDLDIRTAANLAADQAGLRTNGNYTKLQFNATRLQTITPSASGFVALSAQRAGKNLDSSEKFVSGGIYGVRAYPNGEGAGDNGWLANAELRYNLSATWQAAAFYDVGGVDFAKNPLPGTLKNGMLLRGYGLSLAVTRPGMLLRFTVAWRDGQAPVTAPDKQPRFWLMAATAF